MAKSDSPPDETSPSHLYDEMMTEYRREIARDARVCAVLFAVVIAFTLLIVLRTMP